MDDYGIKDDLDLTTMNTGWVKPQSNLSIAKKPLAIGGEKFEHGVCTHAESYATSQLDGKTSWLLCYQSCLETARV